MKYYLDTEFIESPCTIDLISVALASEDGRELYCESLDFDESKASDWVNENVIAKLWSRQQDKSAFNAWVRGGGRGGLMHSAEIAREIGIFVAEAIGDSKPEFWGYYADYDWVAFCWLFGSMIDLPKGWPMYCRDIKQLADSLGNPTLPEQEKGEHNALVDARWNMLAHNFLMTKEEETPQEVCDERKQAA